MPESARILQFPTRSNCVALTRREALEIAELFLGSPAELRSEELAAAALSHPDVLLQVCGVLRERCDVSPATTVGEAVFAFRWIEERNETLGVFDEKDFFLGECALIAAGAYRLLGQRDEVERWLDRADSHFRHTVNPAPLLAKVAYVRLALRYDMGRYEDVVELSRSLSKSFAKLGMERELAKCHYLEAVSLKGSGRRQEARERLLALRSESLADQDAALAGLVRVTLGDLQAEQDEYEPAVTSYQEALRLLEVANRPFALAHLRGVVGETLRRQGRLPAAIEAYRASIEAYAELQMATWVAYLRIVLAETLLESGRPREAEWEILASLPTIEQEKMVPEGFAAIALLRESVRQRKTDPKALLELREYLQAKN